MVYCYNRSCFQAQSIKSCPLWFWCFLIFLLIDHLTKCMLIYQVSMWIIPLRQQPHQIFWSLPTVQILWSTKPRVSICHSLELINLSYGLRTAHPGWKLKKCGISAIVSWIWPTEHLQLLWHDWDNCARTLPAFHSQEYIEFDNVCPSRS